MKFFNIPPIYLVAINLIKLLKALEEMKKNIISPFIELIWDII